ncbi:MAG: O-methyltransferase, partial [candidate division NC10 bacterium]|nr:O-methyltransferase [candidate division NC10 bacterium]
MLRPDIEAYLHRFIPDRDAILAEMERLAETRHFPIVGPVVGRILAQLAQLIGAERVLEMGAGFGYSAYWIARSLPPDGGLLAFERSAENARLAREWFGRAGLDHKVQFIVGDALQGVLAVPGPFDLIFVDVDKEQYPKSLPLTLPRLRQGGLLITDNILWGGRVMAPHPSEASTRGIQEYTRLLYENPDLYTTILPVRDGIA